MTKKEELLEFANSTLDNQTNILELSTEITAVSDGSEIAVGSECYLKIGTSKQRTIEIITLNFNSELVGSLPNDSKVHKINSWNVVPR